MFAELRTAADIENEEKYVGKDADSWEEEDDDGDIGAAADYVYDQKPIFVGNSTSRVFGRR